jgi:hypothetical protein
VSLPFSVCLAKLTRRIIPTGYDKATDDDPRLANLAPKLDVRIRQKTKEVLIEEELSKHK